MASLTAQLAEAVKEALASGVFSTAISPVRRWYVSWTLQELATLRVVVVPGPVSEQPLSRGKDEVRRMIDLAIQRRCNPDSNAEVDSLVELAEELFDFLRAKELTTALGRRAICMARQWLEPEKAAIDPKILSDLRTFTVVVRSDWLVRQ